MIENDLLSYIEKELQRGVAHDAIQEALLVAGWKPLEVADAFRLVTERMHAAAPTPSIESTVNSTVSVGEAFVPAGASKSNIAQESGRATPVNVAGNQSVGKTAEPEPIITENKPDEKIFIGKMKESEAVMEAGFIPKMDTNFPDIKVTEVVVEKPKHNGMLALLIVMGLVVLGGAGYFFVLPILNDSSKPVRAIVTTIETAKSIQYSGEYEITAPAGLVLSDKALVSSFGGVSKRQASAKVKGSFSGVDDWFDYRSKKNEAKFIANISVGGSKAMDFTSLSRVINDVFYSKLSESAAIYDPVIANQGANWVRFDGDTTIPPYAYGFWGGTNLYSMGFPRELAQYLSQAIVGKAETDPTGETIMYVTFTESLVNYFSSIVFAGDKLGESDKLGTTYTLTSLTELPTGQLTFGPDDRIKEAVVAFGYKTKEYDVPVHITFTLSFDRFDTPPAINIPSLVVAYADLEKKDAAADLPETLKGFFSDVRLIASVYKGVNDNSYRGLCIKKGEDTTESTELSIPYISTKVISSGFELPVCSDTDTAWSYYTHSTTGYYCTDSRGYSGKVARQPLGDKCN